MKTPRMFTLPESFFDMVDGLSVSNSEAWSVLDALREYRATGEDPEVVHGGGIFNKPACASAYQHGKAFLDMQRRREDAKRKRKEVQP